MMELILFVLWLVCGVAGFIYWWTKEHDFTSDDILFALIAAILGPVAWLEGWANGSSSEPTVFLKRRG